MLRRDAPMKSPAVPPKETEKNRKSIIKVR